MTINATRGEVWNALTDPEKVKQYMHGTEMSTDWNDGSPIVWRGEWKGRSYEDKAPSWPCSLRSCCATRTGARWAAARTSPRAITPRGSALIVGHSPTTEAAVFGLTGVVVEPVGKGGGIRVVEEEGRYKLEALPADR
jgi:hypothetical protein